MGLQTTMTGILARLFPRLAKIVVGGTITTNSNASLYPTAISNEILGGAHGLDSLVDLANIPNDRLHVPMLATVKEHVVNNQIVKRTTYVLEVLPTGGDRLSDIPNYDISQYWKVFSAIGDYAGSLQVQYAPNIDALTGQVDSNGTTPSFPASRNGVRVTQAEYNNLLEGDLVTIASLGSQITGYWSDTFDSTKSHVWQRQRFGSGTSNTDWGIPVKIAGESYETGDYIANIFIRATSIPATPPQFINGRANNNPTGWFDTPPVGTDKLWLTKAQKDVYGQLKSAWSTPIEIVLNPQLVRYNEKATPNPNNLVYDETGNLSNPLSTSLTDNGWVELYDPNQHKYLATRTEVSSGVYTQWTVIKIADESGEYQDYVFKNFLISETDDVLNNPNVYRPVGTTPLDWSDTPIASTVDQQLFVSSGRKYFNGELIDTWSDPIPFSGSDSFIAYITSTPGDNFKTNPNNGTSVTVPNEIELSAKLFKGVTEITGQSYSWVKFYDDGDLLVPEIDLGTNDIITIVPGDVTGKAIYRCRQSYQGKDFDTEYSILDISDGIDAKHLQLTANANLLLALNAGGFRPATITLKAYSQNLSDEGVLHWKKDGVDVLNQNGTIYEGDELAVDYTDFAVDAEITYTVISTDGLQDTWTIYKTADGSTGAAATLMILSNESHTVVQDAGTGIQDLNGAKTKVAIFEGGTDVTSQWTIRKVDTGLTSTPADGVNLSVGQFIQVTSIPTTSTSGYVTVNATKAGQTLTKQFSVTKIEDPIGSVLVDIDSTVDGFVFTPINQTNKVLIANLYVDGIENNAGIELVEWYLDGTLNTRTQNTLTITPSMVNFNLTVRVRLRYRGIWYARTINITDVKDAKGLGIRYTTRSTDGQTDATGNPIGNDDKPANSVAYNSTNDVFSTSGGQYVLWTINPLNAVYMTIRKDGDTQWGTPIRIKGEAGIQGETGHFIKNIFQWAATKPARPTGNPIPSGWFDVPPTNPNNGNTLWVSLGEIATGNILIGVWSDPISNSGQTGTAGANGLDGNPTLSNSLSVNAGTTSSQNTSGSNNISSIILSNSFFLTTPTRITNNSEVTKTGLFKIMGTAQTDGYSDAILTIIPEYSLDNITYVGITSPYSLDNTQIDLLINAKNSSSNQIIPSNYSPVFFYKVNAGASLWMRFRMVTNNSGQSVQVYTIRTTSILI